MIKFVIVCVYFIFFSCHCWTQRFGVFADFHPRTHHISSGSDHFREMCKEKMRRRIPTPVQVAEVSSTTTSVLEGPSSAGVRRRSGGRALNCLPCLRGTSMTVCFEGLLIRVVRKSVFVVYDQV